MIAKYTCMQENGREKYYSTCDSLAVGELALFGLLFYASDCMGEC